MRARIVPRESFAIFVKNGNDTLMDDALCMSPQDRVCSCCRLNLAVDVSWQSWRLPSSCSAAPCRSHQALNSVFSGRSMRHLLGTVFLPSVTDTIGEPECSPSSTTMFRVHGKITISLGLTFLRSTTLPSDWISNVSWSEALEAEA